jgi:hypothetical protein
VRAVWYNNRLFGKTRNETRLTNWGGAASALLNPDSTGALTVFVFTPASRGKRDLRIWVCRDPNEEDLVGDRVGPVDPGVHLVWRPGATGRRHIVDVSAGEVSCRLTPAQMPSGWLTVFPTGAAIVGKVCELRPGTGESPDERLIHRRDCEFALFQSVEEAIEAPRLKRGFSTVAEFLTDAQRVLQRRKARSGRSLELQTREIFIEEGLIEERDFSHGPESDPGKKPDFLFPSESAYKDKEFPAARLRLLAAKTTCKDRWRQVINEASRIPIKHLLTLQEGISVTQYAEMKAAGVHLVIPKLLVQKFPQRVQGELVTLEDFINSVRHLRTAG